MVPRDSRPAAPGGWGRTFIGILIAPCLVVGCGPTIAANTADVADAELAARVKTALLNDPDVGLQAIEVRVSRASVRLSGRVASSELRDRAVDLARRVAGVRAVESTLEVGPIDEATIPPPQTRVGLPGIAPESDAGSGVIAFGVSVTHAGMTSAGLADALGAGPLVRFASGSGWGPAVGFSWTSARLETGPRGRPALATLRMRPVMAGLEYRRRLRRVTATASMVAGYAFNALEVDPTAAGPDRAIAAANSVAWRSGVSVWYDVTPRVGLKAFIGYLAVRPKVTFASDTAVSSERLKADAVILSIGAAYWLF